MEKANLVLAHDLLLAHPELLGASTPATVAHYQLIIAEQTIDALVHLTESDSAVIRARANQALYAIAQAPASVTIEKINWDTLGQHYCLATFDPILLARAKAAHITVIPLHLPSPWEYHGIRYLLVPPDFIESLNIDGQISHDAWRALFPSAPPLQPNEYLVFYPAGSDNIPRELDEQDPIVLADHWSGTGNSAYRERIGRYSADHDCIEQRHIDPNLSIPRSPNGTGYPAYAAYLDALADPNISCIVVSGPAGSGKTFGAFDYARESIKSGEFTHAIVLKEGKNVLGAVKGGVQEKMAPIVEFGKDALRNIEFKSEKMRKKRRNEAKNGRHEDPEGQPSSVYDQINNSVELSWNNFFTSIPYEYAQGRSIPGAIIIADEFQRTDPDTAYTLLTRQAEESKLIVMGDVEQIFASTEQKRRTNGLSYASRLLYGDPRVVQIRLNLVLRHPIADTITRNRRQVHLELGLPL